MLAYAEREEDRLEDAFAPRRYGCEGDISLRARKEWARRSKSAEKRPSVSFDLLIRVLMDPGKDPSPVKSTATRSRSSATVSAAEPLAETELLDLNYIII